MEITNKIGNIPKQINPKIQFNIIKYTNEEIIVMEAIKIFSGP